MPPTLSLGSILQLPHCVLRPSYYSGAVLLQSLSMGDCLQNRERYESGTDLALVRSGSAFARS